MLASTKVGTSRMLQHSSASAGTSDFAWYLSRHYGENQSHFLQTNSGSRSELTVYRKRSEAPVFGQISAPALEDGFLVSVSLQGDRQQLVSAGRFSETQEYPVNSLRIRDLSEAYSAYLCSPFDFLFFQVTRAALDAVAEESGARRVAALHCEPGVIDPIAVSLGYALIPALTSPSGARALFLEHMSLALNTHFATAYGGMQIPVPRKTGYLSGPQERRAKECLMANIGNDISIAAVAAECGLSRSYFIKAFKITTGTTPHKWILVQRIQQAKAMLRQPESAISEIALECGFADQSHLTRVFTAMVGIPPGAWRRESA